MAASGFEHASNVVGPRASTPNPIKAPGPPNIKEAIMNLADKGLYAIPVRMFWDSMGNEGKGKKDAVFPSRWGHIKDRDSWQKSIATALLEVPDANGLAILTGPSALMVIDVDNSSTKKKLPGTELWNRLVATHGEPSTLRAKTGSNGFHLYFKSNSPGLIRKSNFAGLKSGGDLPYGIDGRSVGGCVYADPACYRDGQGKLLSYEWLNGPPSYETCSEMPRWLCTLVNNGGDSGSTSEIQSVGSPEIPAVCALANQVDPTNRNDDQPSAFNRPSNDTTLLRTELSNMLRKKAGDSSNTYASTLPHGLYGTYFCYRTRGPRTCYLGHRHTGSNNFNLLKRGRNVYYRCHGQDCSHRPPKKLGVLSLKAALQDATTQPVHHFDDMQAITQYTRGNEEVQQLLLKIVAEHAAPQAYFNLGATQAELTKLAEQACLKQRDQSLPSFGKINVQDIADVRKCLPAIVNELYVEDLMDLFDQDNHVANAPNGVIDLRTGDLSPHHPQDLCNNTTCTYIKGASKSSTARFRTFSMDVLPPEYIDWLQIFLGYCLTGETSEELIIIMNGEGSNGKSVLATAIRRAFGSYSTAGNKAIFIKPTFKANASAASSHLMCIKSKRFVTNDESEKDDHLNGSFLKEAASGNPIEARELFCKPQVYIPRYKLCLFTNFRPHFPSDDAALVRRIVLLMFDFIFKSPDELDRNNKRHKPMDLTLKSYFESAEGAADVLDFCVEGAMKYYAKKEQSPESKVLSPIPEGCRAAAREYAAENDKLQCSIDESCVTGVSLSVTKVDFVDRFFEFLCAGGHDTSLAGDSLARAMNIKGFTSTPQDGKKNRMIRMLDGSGRRGGFFGIRLKTEKEMQEESAGDD
ncbi:hypothetical protein KFL_008160020 [Klebsormidium nitens]|uniref:SF3 helicase domain-containing protein n=1 Tax=Klebsormidium nitens TaxID=105231 RepID=A0A1Y1INB2_KLENI|nr:hypothetical protein KFL_008160020 [Klebsormidium nitens]|eukprot:GAQ91602.1 hypothetical protein KFL_008160020 [Klebsormidium nitens]